MRNSYSPEFKAKLVLEVFRRERMRNEIASENNIHPNMLTTQYEWMKKIWLYLTAIIDWYSRYILAWKIVDTLEISFVLEACRNALSNSRPLIINSEQGSHFTSSKFTELFQQAGAISRLTCHMWKTVTNYLKEDCPLNNGHYDQRMPGKLAPYEKP